MSIFRKREVIVILVSFVILWFLPSALQIMGLSPKLKIDWEGFNEEWFKFLADIGKLFFSFFLINIIWEKHKKENLESEKKKKLLGLLSSWKDSAIKTNTSLKILIENIDHNNRHSYEKVRINIIRNQATLSLLSSMILDFSDEIIDVKLQGIISNYNHSVNPHFIELLNSMAEGKMIPGRKISESDQERLKELQTYFSEVSNYSGT